MYKKPYLYLLLVVFLSCKNSNSKDNYVAYFGGEIQNPTSKYILFCKGKEVMDTIFIKKDNTFYKKFDSLTPGLYTFKNEPEYQFVYFDKNDSILVRLNANDFDNSLIFCGRGDQKNNFLMEMYLKNEKDKDKLFNLFNQNVSQYIKIIDKINEDNKAFYNQKKELVKWNDQFDELANAAVDFSYYTRKEIYPYIHLMRTGESIQKELPKDFYNYRKNINFNNKNLEDYTPYAMYINHYINNITNDLYANNLNEDEKLFLKNKKRIQIADSLLTNNNMKELIINNIAYRFFQENKNMEFTDKFTAIYTKIIPDSEQRKNILEACITSRNLVKGNDLPQVQLIDYKGNKYNSKTIFKKQTVIYFWNSKLKSHFEAAHKKIEELQKKFPNYNFIAINLDNNTTDWKKVLDQKNYDPKFEYHAENFENIKEKWSVGKIHRVIILDKFGTIKNGFSNLFDLHFENELN